MGIGTHGPMAHGQGWSERTDELAGGRNRQAGGTGGRAGRAGGRRKFDQRDIAKSGLDQQMLLNENDNQQ